MLSKKTTVLFSSGHDSFYCLMLALDKYGKSGVNCLIFRYGQTNLLEIDNAINACTYLDIQYSVIDLPPMNKDFNKRKNVSAQYYPARNLVMLSVGCSIAEQTECESLYIGVCLEDNDLFPDCRKNFVKSFSELYASAYGDLQIVAPCLQVTKKQSYDQILSSDLFEVYKKYTYSCYNNSQEVFLDRKGCGKCGACLSISKGIFNEK